MEFHPEDRFLIRHRSGYHRSVVKESIAEVTRTEGDMLWIKVYSSDGKSCRKMFGLKKEFEQMVTGKL